MIIHKNKFEADLYSISIQRPMHNFDHYATYIYMHASLLAWAVMVLQ